MTVEPVTVTIPAATIETIAARAAELVLAELGSRRASSAEYLTVAETADYLRCSPQRVYDLLSSRRLRRHKDGRRVLVPRHELDMYLSRSNIGGDK